MRGQFKDSESSKTCSLVSDNKDHYCTSNVQVSSVVTLYVLSVQDTWQWKLYRYVIIWGPLWEVHISIPCQQPRESQHDDHKRQGGGNQDIKDDGAAGLPEAGASPRDSGSPWGAGHHSSGGPLQQSGGSWFTDLPRKVRQSSLSANRSLAKMYLQGAKNLTAYYTQHTLLYISNDFTIKFSLLPEDLCDHHKMVTRWLRKRHWKFGLHNFSPGPATWTTRPDSGPSTWWTVWRPLVVLAPSSPPSGLRAHSPLQTLTVSHLLPPNHLLPPSHLPPPSTTLPQPTSLPPLLPIFPPFHLPISPPPLLPTSPPPPPPSSPPLPPPTSPPPPPPFSTNSPPSPPPPTPHPCRISWATRQTCKKTGIKLPLIPSWWPRGVRPYLPTSSLLFPVSPGLFFLLVPTATSRNLSTTPRKSQTTWSWRQKTSTTISLKKPCGQSTTTSTTTMMTRTSTPRGSPVASALEAPSSWWVSWKI